MKTSILGFGALVFAVLAPSAPSAATPETLTELSNATRAARLSGDRAAWRDLGLKTLALAPDHPDLLISAARAAAAAGQPAEALDRLAAAVRRGAGLDPAALPELAGLETLPGAGPVFVAARHNFEPLARSRTFAMVPDKTTRPEGIVYDPAARRLFIGTVRGDILQIDAKGAITPFASAPASGLLEVYGLKIDPARQLLWAANGVFPDVRITSEASRPDLGVTGLAAFRLSDGALVRQIKLDERPTFHGFNDMAVALDGTVYVTDSIANAIYRLAPGARDLELLIRDQRMSFPNGLVITPDQKRLIVAHIEGLSAVDLRSRARRQLKTQSNMSVNSIDGLAFDGDRLIGVQSSPYLARLIRISLDAQATAVTQVEVLNARSPQAYSATTAAVAPDGDIFLIAGTPTVDPAGKPLAEEPSPRVLQIAKSAARTG